MAKYKPTKTLAKRFVYTFLCTIFIALVLSILIVYTISLTRVINDNALLSSIHYSNSIKFEFLKILDFFNTNINKEITISAYAEFDTIKDESYFTKNLIQALNKTSTTFISTNTLPSSSTNPVTSLDSSNKKNSQTNQ